MFNHVKKAVCFSLALMMLAGSLIACGDSHSTPSDDTTPSNVAEGETKETLDIPSTRYDDQILTFLVRDGDDTWGTTEIYCEKITDKSDPFSAAVYERNLQIYNDYGVTIEEIRKAATTHSETIQREVLAPTNEFQAIVSDTTNLTSLTSAGALLDLNSYQVEYLDFTKSWWDTKMAESMSINDHLYFATGDLLIDDNEATFAMMFNKDLAKDYKLEDMYALVNTGNWTLAKFYEMEQKVIHDAAGDGRLDYGVDTVGFAYTTDTAYCILFGSGITLCTKDENDYPLYDLNIERTQNITDIGRRILANSCALNLVTSDTDGVAYWDAGDITFSNNKALFYAQCMNTVSGLRNYEVNFGILPFPKYDQAQPNYYSLMHCSSGASFAIPRSVKTNDLPMITSMIEAMAYYAVDTLTEQYYEINLKLKSAQDEQSSPMIDLILANRVYDLAYYYGWGNNAYTYLADGLISGNSSSVASSNQRFKSLITKNIETLINDMDKLD